MKKFPVFALLLLSLHISNAQLIINELSQGPSGTKEYVELLVTGSPVCNAANTVDLRGWIIDDNNSWHATGSGTGIAAGHVRFDSVSIWANVKIGTLILIYNDADTSSSVAALSIDTSDADNNCSFIIPISSALLQKNTTLPASNGTMSTYNVGGTVYSSAGTWSPLGMSNNNDAFHTVSPADYSTPYHSIGWGADTALLNVYFNISQGGLVIYMANTVDNNPFNQLNFIDTTASSHETPGAPNNGANAQWIASLSNNCQPLVSLSVSINAPLLLTCSNPEVILTAVSTASVFEWSNGISGATDTVTAAGSYEVTVSDASGGCSASASVTVNANTTAPDVSIATPDSMGCGIVTDTLFASSNTSGVTYDWGGGITTSENIISLAGNYSVTATDPANGCTSSASVTVHSTANIVIVILSANTSCGNNNGLATASVTSGNAEGYVWSSGDTTAVISNLSPGNYAVTVDGGSGCSAVSNVTIASSNAISVTVVSDKSIMCSGDTATICPQQNFASYIWNTGDTTHCIQTVLAGNYYITVTDAFLCTAASNHFVIGVYPVPPVSITVNGDTLIAYNAVTYQWYLNGTAIQSATSNIYIAQQSGDYSVEVSDSNGCAATSTNVNVVTGINDLMEENEVSIYPNPLTTGGWELTVTNNLLGGIVSVFDIEGRIVFQTEIRNPVSEIDLVIPAGLYLLKLTSRESMIIRKLIKL